MIRKFFSVLAAVIAVGCTAVYEVPDAQDVVMYQVNPRVFAADHSFTAVKDRLDSIEALGVNVLWFMPVYEIGQEKSVNSPYCIKDYRALNPEFGTVREFDDMVKEAHKRGMSVILDWVANHTSWDSDWIKENPDWYTRDSLGNIIHPAGTGWRDVADLDFGNQDMRRAMMCFDIFPDVFPSRCQKSFTAFRQISSSPVWALRTKENSSKAWNVSGHCLLKR